MIKYILYDLDGVLVDACDWHYHSLNQALYEIASYKIDYAEHLSTYNGLPTRVKLNILAERNIIQKKDFDIIFYKKQLYTKDAIIKYSQVDEKKIFLHRSMQEIGIRLACVTNSIRETAELMLKVTGQLQFMDFLVCNEDVSKNKPYAEPYLLAINKFAANKNNVLIIEDSENGIKSAKASGANLSIVSNPTEVDYENMIKWIKNYE